MFAVILIDANEVQLANDKYPNDLTVEGKETDSILLQLIKARSPIPTTVFPSRVPGIIRLACRL